MCSRFWRFAGLEDEIHRVGRSYSKRLFEEVFEDVFEEVFEDVFEGGIQEIRVCSRFWRFARLEDEIHRVRSGYSKRYSRDSCV